MDLFEPWVIRSALVVGALAAVNVWLFMLSINQPCEIPASSSPRQSHGQFPNPDTAQAAVAATDTSVGGHVASSPSRSWRSGRTSNGTIWETSMQDFSGVASE
jgi:hypothetical protein